MQGSIFVEEGHIVHAQIGDRTGEEGFNQLLSLSGGHFSLKPFTEPSARTISGPWEFLVMEAARQRDEAMSDQAASAPPVETAPAAAAVETDAPAAGDEMVLIDAET